MPSAGSSQVERMASSEVAAAPPDLRPSDADALRGLRGWRGLRGPASLLRLVRAGGGWPSSMLVEGSSRQPLGSHDRPPSLIERQWRPGIVKQGEPKQPLKICAAYRQNASRQSRDHEVNGLTGRAPRPTSALASVRSLLAAASVAQAIEKRLHAKRAPSLSSQTFVAVEFGAPLIERQPIH